MNFRFWSETEPQRIILQKTWAEGNFRRAKPKMKANESRRLLGRRNILAFVVLWLSKCLWQSFICRSANFLENSGTSIISTPNISWS